MSIRNVYSPYGYRGTQPATTGALGFNGQFFHAELGCYALGNGHRIYNPRMMRFISPDAYSPFLKGGINSYIYCLNDPVNGHDPSGKWTIFKNLRPRALTAARAMKDSMFPAQGATLKNNGAVNLADEVLRSRLAIKAASVDYTVVASKNTLNLLDWKQTHKYVLTENNEFAIFSADSDANLPTHASLAERLGLAASDSVISAGYISRRDGEFHIDNFSGHYQPPPQRLHVAEQYLGTLGIKVKLVRVDSGFSF
ncbi:RHS repeat-associated core domain-containing protein [Pseudomonas sp. NPDC089547]|uniref:RHS repeat-associated core domain-containing protein n=1 Tax=Pseudomonas sp. NPDC089547 TaxID=3390652 RepID=UPI003CFD5039